VEIPGQKPRPPTHNLYDRRSPCHPRHGTVPSPSSTPSVRPARFSSLVRPPPARFRHPLTGLGRRGKRVSSARNSAAAFYRPLKSTSGSEEFFRVPDSFSSTNSFGRLILLGPRNPSNPLQSASPRDSANNAGRLRFHSGKMYIHHVPDAQRPCALRKAFNGMHACRPQAFKGEQPWHSRVALGILGDAVARRDTAGMLASGLHRTLPRGVGRSSWQVREEWR
jgi:hypothetical protein